MYANFIVYTQSPLLKTQFLNGSLFHRWHLESVAICLKSRKSELNHNLSEIIIHMTLKFNA